MTYIARENSVELSVVNGSIAANPVIWHSMIMRPTNPSNDVVLPGTQQSKWTVRKGASTGKEYENSDDGLAL